MPQEPRPKQRLDPLRGVLRTPHDAMRTEHAYVAGARRCMLWPQQRHPTALRRVAIAVLLPHLAVDRHRAASTHHPALSALLFLYKEVLRQEMGSVDAVRARPPQRLPTVLTTPEALQGRQAMVGVPPVRATRLYGSGGRGLAGRRGRGNDVDGAQQLRLVRDGTGAHERSTLVPETLVAPFQEHVVRVQPRHTPDLAAGDGAVYLPYALERTSPNAHRAWGWQSVLPATSRSVDPRTGIARRHHLDERRLQQAIRAAARVAGTAKHVTGHTFRHAFAPQWLEAGDDMRTVQAWLGPRDVKTMVRARAESRCCT